MTDEHCVRARRIRSFLPQRRAQLLRRMMAAATIVAVGGFAAACSDSTGPKLRPVKSIILENHHGDVAYMHGDHWHGSLSVVPGGSEHIHIYYLDKEAEGHDVPPESSWLTLPTDRGYEISVVSANPAVASWVPDSPPDNVREGSLEGGATEGATTMTFIVKRNGTTVYETAPVNVVVSVDAHDDDDDDHDHDH